MWLNGLLVTVLAVSVVTDLKERRIYNKLLFPALALAFILQTAAHGWNGLLSALAGFAVGLSILMIPYLMGGMGAGDVKLLGFVGACKGMGFVLAASIYMGLAGGALALLVLLFRKGSIRRLKWAAVAVCCFQHGIRMPLLPGREAMSVGTPYGVAIAAGAVTCLWWKGLVLG